MFFLLETCQSPGYFLGDGTCDDDANSFACSFDDGDCCGSNVKKDFCIDCICLEPDSIIPSKGNKFKQIFIIIASFCMIFCRNLHIVRNCHLMRHFSVWRWRQNMPIEIDQPYTA